MDDGPVGAAAGDGGEGDVEEAWLLRTAGAQPLGDVDLVRVRG